MVARLLKVARETRMREARQGDGRASPTLRPGAPRFLPLSALSDDVQPLQGASDIGAALGIADWVRAYLMRPHPELGRDGAVCPYTPIAARIDAIRIAASPAREEAAILGAMIEAVAVFAAIECAKHERPFRAVMVGFPNCRDEEGRRRLRRVQNRLRLRSIFGGKMFGLFEPDWADRGLVNPEFRPLRSPVPLLAIRMLVEQDAPFVARNPALAPIYLLKFPLAGMRRLAKRLWR